MPWDECSCWFGGERSRSSRDAHPNDDKTVVRMGHPDCAATGEKQIPSLRYGMTILPVVCWSVETHTIRVDDDEAETNFVDPWRRVGDAG